jgi:hypothetical protein
MQAIKKYQSISAKSILICFLITFFFHKSHAQTQSELIAAIRKNFRSINADRALTKKMLSNEEFLENMPDGGGELTGYFKKDSIVKIVEWIGLSYGNRTREFYFKNNKPFFVYEKLESFIIIDSTREMDYSKTKKTFEGRYYFNKDILIEQKTTGKRTFEDESAGIVKELLESAKENIKLLKQKE